ncbi:MAG TPA: glycoside hydrolase family 66 protein, partial [Ktedonobacteraceae bacterium]|nr:glycoside hydrolase family 66 protein [Ktedonobacteraceae bacterium]
MSTSCSDLLDLEDVWPDRAFYRPGESAHLCLLVCNRAERPVTVSCWLTLSWLDQELSSESWSLEVQPGRQRFVLPLALPRTAFRGYGVDVKVCDEWGQSLACKSTALDVLENWTQAPRYGFLADFAPEAPEAEEVGDALARFHLNLVQFYDWMWRHYVLVPPEEEFADALRRRISLRVVRERVAACRARGIAAMGYAAVYGAEPEYALEHPDEMLYDAEGEPYSLEKLFYIMNIHADNPWRERILREMARAVREVSFDGLHLDQYGFPKENVFGPAPERVPYDLAEDFPAFIAEARQAIRVENPEARVIFNLVENWPVQTVAPSTPDAVYIEVWPPYTAYADLQRLLLDARRLAGGKQVILAAYLSPLQNAQGEELLRAEAATRLASAAIWANGGFHLVVGEREGILSGAYYPSYERMRSEFAGVMRRLYDFVVRYENVLSDGRLETVPAAEVGERVRLRGVGLSGRGEGGGVWGILRRMPQCITLSLINLTGVTDARWNVPQAVASVVRDVCLEVRVEGVVVGVYAATP